MGKEKRMIGDYTVLSSVNVGEKEIIIASNEQSTDGETFLCGFVERNDLFELCKECVVAEAKRNDDKYEKRSSRTLDVYGYEDDITESFHKELITDFEGQFDLEEKARLEREAEQKRTCDILKVRKALSMLQPIQRQRLLKFILEGKCYRQIAAEEGTYHSSVSKSIEAAIKNFKKFFENL